MDDSSEDLPGDPGPVLVIGAIESARLLCAQVSATGGRSVHLLDPTVDQLAAARAAGPWAGVAIIAHSDVQALRYALLVEQVQPGVHLVVTVFRRTMAHELARLLPNCVVTSPADLAAPTVAAAFLPAPAGAVPVAVTVPEEGAGAGRRGAGPARVAVVDSQSGPRWQDWDRPSSLSRRVRRWLVPRWYGGREGLALTGALGLVSILLIDWVVSMLVLHEGPLTALYAATRIVSTVGPADATSHGAPAWYLVLAVILMLAAIGFTGAFVAGLVEWLVTPRTAGLLGRRQIPTRGHVVIVGLGQVGLRAAVLLQRIGVPVVAIEQSRTADNLALARTYRVPVIVGDGQRREVLARSRAEHALGVAALGSNDVGNIATAIMTRALAPETPVLIRAGEDPMLGETGSLIRLGRVVEVSALTAVWVCRAVRLAAPDLVAGGVAEGEVHVLTAGEWSRESITARCSCSA